MFRIGTQGSSQNLATWAVRRNTFGIEEGSE